jgi:molybdopterin-binding protein
MNKMELSARNQLKGKVESVTTGQVMASIKIKVEDPKTITAVITKESVEKLDIKEGDDITAIIKSTEVIVAKD